MVFRPRKAVAYKKRAYKPKSLKKVIKTAVRKQKVRYIRKIVKSVMKKKTETKIAEPYTQNNLQVLPFDTGTTLFGTEISLITPLINIAQGTAQGQRIGNRIDVSSMKMKGYITVQKQTGQNSNNQPVYVKLVFLRRKNNQLPINSVPVTNFFQNGNTTQAPTNSPTDIMRYINKDVFTVYDTRLFKLGFADGGLNVLSGPNNDFKLSKMFSVNLSKHIGKLIYDDNGAQPNNWACYCVALMCNNDGSNLSAATAPQVELNFDIETKYKDY